MRSVWLLTLMFIAGCGPRGPTKHPVDPGKPVDRVIMEPMVLEAQKVGDDLQVISYDAALLFDEAFALYQQDLFDEARKMYARILEQFPETVLAPPAMFNMALCDEKLGDLQAASGIYDELVDTYPDSEAALHAMFRRGYCLEALERLDEAIAQYQEVLALDGIPVDDTLEAMSRVGHLLLLAGRESQAEDALTLAVQFYVQQSQIERFDNAFYAAQAQYDLAEIERALFESVEFTTDEAQIREALDEKLGYMVEASDAYVQAIKIGNYYWAVAAGYQVGQLLRTLYDQMVQAPVPPELDTEELVQTYYDFLREYIRPLLERAVSVWEKTLLMAERVGIDCEWVDLTEEKMRQTRDMLAEELMDEEQPEEIEPLQEQTP